METSANWSGFYVWRQENCMIIRSTPSPDDNTILSNLGISPRFFPILNILTVKVEGLQLK